MPWCRPRSDHWNILWLHRSKYWDFPEAQARGTICLANATLVLPEQVVSGYLLLKDGEISEIGEGTQVPDGAVDCAGAHVIPGPIELHTDNLERHLEPRLLVVNKVLP